MKTEKLKHGFPKERRVWLEVVPLVGFLILVQLSHIWAQETKKVHPENTIKAVRINPATPRIDGILDDEVWQHAPASDNFLQKEPKEGEPPTEKTTVQIVYDDEALYVGVMCYDSEPDKIVARLARRDEWWVESDRVRLNLDAYHDHQTGCWFSVNAAGVKGDAQIYNDGAEDCSWDGVWEAKAAINDKGWSVEYKIPYHVLRFNPKEEYTWGMNLGRCISRKNEQDVWVLVRKGEHGCVSRFGHIEGIRNIKPPGHLEVKPFAVGRSMFMSESPDNPDGRDLFSSAGVDVQYGLSSNISLKPVSVGYHIDGSEGDNGSTSGHSFCFGIGIRPASNIQINIGPAYRTGYDFAQWVRNIDDADGRHYVFGELKNKILDLSTRVNVSFTPNLSFQLYLQPFVAVGDYSNFKELAHPESYEFKPYTRLDFNPDFVPRSLRGNAVLRWEYRPGSVLFLVWTQSRSAFMETDKPSLRPYEDLRSSFTDKGQNVFLVKLNYWLGL